MNTCRSCKANIIWVRTVRGKNHPLDAYPSPDGEWVISTKVTPSGAKQEVMLKATPMDADAPHYTSHFATCKDADQHRRKR